MSPGPSLLYRICCTCAPNPASHKPRLHNAQEISRRSQLHNAHEDVDIGRIVANKSEYCNLTTSKILILESLFPFHFLISNLCNWLLGLLLWSLHHFVNCDLNWLTMKAKVESVQSVSIFVHNFMLTHCWFWAIHLGVMGGVYINFRVLACYTLVTLRCCFR